MQIMSTNDKYPNFNGRIDRSAKRFINKQIKEYGNDFNKKVSPSTRESVYFAYRNRSLDDLSKFMAKFHKDTVLKIDNKNNVSEFYIINKKADSKLNFHLTSYLSEAIVKDSVNVASPSINRQVDAPEKVMIGIRNFADNFMRIAPEVVDEKLYELGKSGGKLKKIKAKLNRPTSDNFVNRLIRDFRLRKYNNLVLELGHSEDKILR